MDSVRLEGGKYMLIKIYGPEDEAHCQSGYMICNLNEEDGDEESQNLLKLDRCVMVGSLSSRDFYRTSLVQEILEHDKEKDSVTFATLNSKYRIEAM